MYIIFNMAISWECIHDGFFCVYDNSYVHEKMCVDYMCVCVCVCVCVSRMKCVIRGFTVCDFGAS